MAEIDVKNQSSKQGSETDQQGSGSGQQTSQSGQQTSQSGGQGLQRQQGQGLSRSRGGDPWGSFLSPYEFFSSNPFSLMRRMSEEMDRAFGHAFGQTSGGRGGWFPAVEVAERNGQLQVHAELPGLKPEDVKVEITDDALVIHGERKHEQEHHIGKAYHSERRYGTFYREISLPPGVNAEQAKAQFRDGVLEVSVPIPEEASRRREIPIDTGGASTSSSSGGGASASAAAAGSQSGGESSTTRRPATQATSSGSSSGAGAGSSAAGGQKR